MAKIDFNIVIKDFEDKEIGDKKISLSELKKFIGQLIMNGSNDMNSILTQIENICKYEKLTIGDVCRMALINIFEGDDKLDGIEKMKRFDLALKLKKGGKIEVSTEEISMMKSLVAKMQGTLIMGRVWSILDPKG